ncbi:TPR repeat-containing protein [Phaffia rhodozyma]|uniref:TPR repeat-containing protein n=1 Tax=Phaffia rhodozyma TaxID=264483 RepID=A0A0F7SWT9_PHARH|nr:TPR repeat-containing protein [Phaffia rhodozyma]
MPSLPSKSRSTDEDETLSNMFARLQSHQPSTSSELSPPGSVSSDGSKHADDDDEEEETWADALTGEDTEEDLPKKHWTTDDLVASVAKAESLKTKANAQFNPGKAYHQALQTYLSVLAALPSQSDSISPQKTGQPSQLKEEEGLQIVEVDEEEAARIERGETEEERKRRNLEEKVVRLRAVIWGNVAACYLRLNQYKETVEACTEALKDDPEYVKALHRRITANTAIDSWSSLQSALDDAKKLLPLLPSNSPIRSEIQLSVRDLPGKVNAKGEKEKAEMMGKLKNLGNSVLGTFGLSTDNFKFEPNGQGGYMTFVPSSERTPTAELFPFRL